MVGFAPYGVRECGVLDMAGPASCKIIAKRFRGGVGCIFVGSFRNTSFGFTVPADIVGERATDSRHGAPTLETRMDRTKRIEALRAIAGAAREAHVVLAEHGTPEERRAAYKIALASEGWATCLEFPSRRNSTQTARDCSAFEGLAR